MVDTFHPLMLTKEALEIENAELCDELGGITWFHAKAQSLKRLVETLRLCVKHFPINCNILLDAHWPHI